MKEQYRHSSIGDQRPKTKDHLEWLVVGGAHHAAVWALDLEDRLDKDQRSKINLNRVIDFGVTSLLYRDHFNLE